MNLFTNLKSTSCVNYLDGKSICYRLACSSLLALTLTFGVSFQAHAAEPVEYVESVESSVSSHSDAESIVKKAINSHSTYITISGDETTLKSAKNTAFRVLSNPLHNYEEGTLNEVNSHISNGKCEIVLGRVSTINEEKAVNDEVARLLPQFNQGSAYDKVKAVHDYLCTTVAYSYSTVANADDYRSAYDALINKTAVCTGYALSFQKFMDEMGIPCYIAYSNTHAWNIVNVDGTWYHIDCTNDDQEWGISYHDFLVGSADAGYSSWGNITISDTNYR